MTTNDNAPQAQNDGPEQGATEEAIALHGNRAAAEKYEQPDAVTLPGDTRVARRDADAPEGDREQ